MKRFEGFRGCGADAARSALAALRANKAVGRRRAGARPVVAAMETLVDDATLLRLLRGPDATVGDAGARAACEALRRWVRRTPEGRGLYEAYAPPRRRSFDA